LKLRIPSLALAVVGLLALTSGNALATGTLDQQQTITTDYAIHWNETGMAFMQGFKAGLAGNLDTIEVNANGFGHPVDFMVQGATILDEQTVTLNDGGWTTIHLNTPGAVLATATYYLVLTPSTGEMQWNGACSAAYSGGISSIYIPAYKNQYVTIPTYGATHGGVGYCEQAFAFKTYVTTASVPTATPVTAPTKAPTKAPAAAASAPSAGSSPSASAATTDTAADTASIDPSPASSDIAAIAPAPSTAAATPAPAASSGGSSGSGSMLPILLLAVVVVVGLAGGGAWFATKRRQQG